MVTCAAFVKESRIKIANPTKLDRKFAGAEWRACPGVPWDLRFLFPVFNSNPVRPGTRTISSV
jgi:hypothetical protein